MGRTLIIIGIVLMLYPGFHKTANNSQTHAAPPCLSRCLAILFLRQKQRERESMDSCWRQGAVLLFAGIGFVVFGTWVSRRRKNPQGFMPSRQDRG